MQIKTVFQINTVLATVHGLAFVFFTRFALDFYKVPLSLGAEVMGKLFGAHLIGLALYCWRGSQLSDPAGQRAIGFGTLVNDVLGVVIVVWAIQVAGMGAMGWLGAAIYGLLALGYALALKRLP